MSKENNIYTATAKVKLVFVNDEELTEEEREGTIATIRVGVIRSPFKKVVDKLIKSLDERINKED